VVKTNSSYFVIFADIENGGDLFFIGIADCKTQARSQIRFSAVFKAGHSRLETAACLAETVVKFFGAVD
jgi:hypothetical protein